MTHAKVTKCRRRAKRNLRRLLRSLKIDEKHRRDKHYGCRAYARFFMGHGRWPGPWDFLPASQYTLVGEAVLGVAG